MVRFGLGGFPAAPPTATCRVKASCQRPPLRLPHRSRRRSAAASATRSRPRPRCGACVHTCACMRWRGLGGGVGRRWHCRTPTPCPMAHPCRSKARSRNGKALLRPSTCSARFLARCTKGPAARAWSYWGRSSRGTGCGALITCMSPTDGSGVDNKWALVGACRPPPAPLHATARTQVNFLDKVATSKAASGVQKTKSGGGRRKVRATCAFPPRPPLPPPPSPNPAWSQWAPLRTPYPGPHVRSALPVLRPHILHPHFNTCCCAHLHRSAFQLRPQLPSPSPSITRVGPVLPPHPPCPS
jgi:hypothetical protein